MFIHLLKNDYSNEKTLALFLKAHFNPSVNAVYLFRLSSFFWRHKLLFLAKLAYIKNIKKNGTDISFKANIGSGLRIGHTVGIVIGPDATIGSNCLIQSGVVIGAKSYNQGGGKIEIGNNCYIGAGAKIIGIDIKVGDNVTIGANAVVVKNTSNNCTLVGVPAKEIEANL